MKAKAISFLFFFSFYLFAQTQETPQVIPPSPEASALFRSLNYSVNHATGVPQISIPIYEVKSGSLTLPISIIYFAGGRREDDETGPIGVGWSLNAGGMISRTIHGKPDDESMFPVNGLRTSASINQRQDYGYLASLYYDITQGGTYDSEYDIFSYSMGSLSGKFVYNGTRDNVYLMPKRPLYIAPGGFPSHIIDDKGVKYEFNEFEFNNTLYAAATGAYLTKMISADKKDEITFTYQYFTKLCGVSRTNELIVDHIRQPALTNIVSYQYTTMPPSGLQSFTIRRLKEINFREGKIVFNLHSNSDQVSNIQIKDKNGNVLKTISFTSSASMLQKKLDKIEFKDKAGETKEVHSFEYYQETTSTGVDFWGYLNGSASTGVPPWYVYNKDDPGQPYWRYLGVLTGNSSRLPNDYFSKAGVLKKITYPTGGSSEFIYEGHKVWNPEYDKRFIGGLRIKEIKTNDANGNTATKTYKYGVNEDGFGYKSYYPDVSTMSAETRTFPYFYSLFDESSTIYAASFRTRVYTPDVSSAVSDAVNEPVYYGEVAEYEGTPESNNGKTVYTFNVGGAYQNAYHSFAGSRSSPGLSYCSDNPFLGPFDFGYETLNTPEPVHMVSYHLWNAAEPLSTTYYKPSGISSPAYKEVKKSINVYDDIIETTLVGMHVYKYSEIPEGGGYNFSFLEQKAACYGIPVFLYGNYEMHIGRKELKETITKDYTDAGEIVHHTYYTYNDKNLLSETKQVTSTGDEMITKIKYPFNFTSDPALGLVSQEMMVRNMVNYPVLQESYKNTVFLQHTKTKYDFWNINNWGTNTSSSIILPRTVETKMKANTAEIRLRYHSYGEGGNVTAVSKEDDIQKVYIWGYNKTYPVAEVVGVPYSTAMGMLDQNILDNPSDDATLRNHLNILRSINGAQVITYTYKPLVGITSQTDINNRTTYYEYDAYGRLIVARDQNGKILKQNCYNYAGQIENCTVVQFGNVQKQGTFTKQNCSSGTGGSVTYTIAANTYYSTVSVDEANRLAQADVDANGQAYANANAPCLWYNVAKSGNFTKSCTSGGTGSTVTYTVAANTYSSTTSQADADQQAQNAVNANGQAYANANGTCTWYNEAQSGNFTRNNCSSGTGSTVTYTVAANTYSSTTSLAAANQLAMNAVNANGQNYANANGTCTAPQVTVLLSNYTGNYYYVSLVNTQTNVDYGTWLFSSEYDIPLNVPEGTYNIYVSFDTQPDPAWIGACGYSTYGIDATFYNVTVNYQNRYVTMQY